MKIQSFEGGYDKNLSYIIYDESDSECAIVDAAVPVESISSHIADNHLNPTALLITHSHHDHVCYLNDYLETFEQLAVYAFDPHLTENQKTFQHGDNITAGSINFSVIHTPGHTPESCCFLAHDSMFTGDTLFVGRTGRTISAGSNTRHFYRSVYEKILTLPQNTIIYPGHNYGSVPYISIEDNIKISPLLQAENEDDFVRRMDEFEASRVSV